MAEPSAPSVTGRRPRRRRWLLALAAALAAGGAFAWLAREPLAGAGRRVERRYVRWRVERFLAQAAEAARAERPQVAVAALESAAALAPGNWSIRLARSDQLLVAGRAEEAWRLWEEWLAGPAGDRPAQLPLLFAGRLIAAGEFARLARLATAELARSGAAAGTWLNLAAEAAVLAGAPPDPAAAGAPPDPMVRGVLAGYQRARRGDRAGAVAALEQAGGAAMPWPLAFLAARAWRAAGDAPRARVALARTTGPVEPWAAVLQEALFVERGSMEEARLLRGALPRGLERPERARRAALFMFFTLDAPSSDAAEILSAEFLPGEPALETTLVASLWLYCALARADREERAWRARLEARLRAPPPPVAAGPLTIPLLRLTVERIPLPLEMVCALMARAEPATR